MLRVGFREQWDQCGGGEEEDGGGGNAQALGSGYIMEKSGKVWAGA